MGRGEEEGGSEERLGRLLDRVMSRSNDALSVATGTMGTQSSLIASLQALNLTLNDRITRIQNENGELKRENIAVEQLRADTEIRRGELELKSKKTDAAIKALEQVGKGLLLEMGSRRRTAGAPSPEGETAVPQSADTRRSLITILEQAWAKLSSETIAAITTDAGPELVIELLSQLERRDE